MICGPLTQHGPSPRATALDPLVLVEITSDSSEIYDHGVEADAYRTIPSLLDYVIVSHRERRITLFHRLAEGSWTRRVAVTDGEIEVESVGAVLNVNALYRRSAIAQPEWSGPERPIVTRLSLPDPATHLSFARFFAGASLGVRRCCP